MASISNSSIQPWLDFRLNVSLNHVLNFNPETLPATIPPCRTKFQNASEVLSDNCTQVCNKSTSLIQPENPNSLLTCGLWVTLVTMDSYNERSKLVYPKLVYPELKEVYEVAHEHYQNVLQRFAPLGLDAGDEAYFFAAKEAVSMIMFAMLKNRDFSSQGLCSQQELFSLAIPEKFFHVAVYGIVDIPERVRDCVAAICAPASLNPDLGGIGVSMTYSTITPS